MAKYDFKINDDNDLAIINGDFVIEPADKTQAKFIILANKGEIRQYPLLGVGLNKFIGSSVDDDVLYNFVKDEIAKDGFILDDLKITRDGNNITIDLELK